jgi:hypothetical protein
MTRCDHIKAVRFSLALLALVAVTGCVKIDSTLDVDADGAGTWRLVYAMPVHMIKQIEMTQGMSRELDRASKGVNRGLTVRTDDMPYIFEESVVRERFKGLETQGIMLNKLSTRSQGGWRYVDLTVKFTRLETLLRQPFFDSCGFVLSGAGTSVYKLLVTLPEMGNPAELPNLDDPSVSERVTPFMNGLRVTARIGVPSEIRNSNSVSSDPRRATWEWDFDRDSRTLTRLAQDKMILFFKGDGVRLRDFTKPAVRE